MKIYFLIVLANNFIEKKDELIYELIFTEKKDFQIDIAMYIPDIYEYEEFVSDIKSILKKSKVKITKSNVKLDSKTALWELKVTK